MKMRTTMTFRSTIINNTKQQALTEGSEQVAEQTSLSSVWQSPCNRRGHWDSERRWVRICLADPKSAFLWSATTRHSNPKIPSQFQTGSQDTLVPETPFMSLNFFLLPSQSQNPGQRSSISSIFAPSAHHLQIYPSSQSTKTISSKTAQRGKAMAWVHASGHTWGRREQTECCKLASLAHALCMIHTRAQEERKQINTYKRILCNSEDKRTEKVYQHVSKMWSL